MKKLTACLTAMLFAGGLLAQTNWTIDKEHSSINFTVSHYLVGQTAGRFKEFDASVISRTDDNFNDATVTFTAKTASVCTDNEQRDRHLRTDGFLGSEIYPEIHFNGTIVKEGSSYLLKGNLTIRDITRPVSFFLAYAGRLKESTYKADKAGFTLTGTLSRAAYGLTWNETFEGGRPIIGDTITLLLYIEINREQKP